MEDKEEVEYVDPFKVIYTGEGQKRIVESRYPSLEAMFFVIRKDGEFVRYNPSRQEIQDRLD
jgi:hypothetical protein